MSSLSEYDLRQLSRMRDVIVDFNEGKATLASMVDDLDGLLACLESVPSNIVDSLREHWGMLENRRAVLLEQSLSKAASAKADEIVGPALKSMELLLARMLSPARQHVRAFYAMLLLRGGDR